MITGIKNMSEIELKRKQAALLRLQTSYAENEIQYLEKLEQVEAIKKSLEGNLAAQCKLEEEIKQMRGV
jgi:hypothetical protein